MCDAATALLHLSSLAASSKEAAATAASSTPLEEQLQSVERAQELAWLLCDTLGSAQALMERHGRFVQVGRKQTGLCREGTPLLCVFWQLAWAVFYVQPQVTRAWRAGCSTGSAAPSASACTQPPYAATACAGIRPRHQWPHMPRIQPLFHNLTPPLPTGLPVGAAAPAGTAGAAASAAGG